MPFSFQGLRDPFRDLSGPPVAFHAGIGCLNGVSLWGDLGRPGSVGWKAESLSFTDPKLLADTLVPHLTFAGWFQRVTLELTA